MRCVYIYIYIYIYIHTHTHIYLILRILMNLSGELVSNRKTIYDTFEMRFIKTASKVNPFAIA